VTCYLTKQTDARHTWHDNLSQYKVNTVLQIFKILPCMQSILSRDNFVAALTEQSTNNVTGTVIVLHQQDPQCLDRQEPFPPDDRPLMLLLLLVHLLYA